MRSLVLALTLTLVGCGPSDVEREAERPFPVRPNRFRVAVPRKVPPPVPDPPGTFRKLAYGPDPMHRLDLFLPLRKGATLVVFVHGGAWIGGTRHMMEAAARTFAQRGVAAATVDYRLSHGPGLVYPVHAEDVAAALGWLVARAPKYGYNPRKVVVVGHSAGAHIAGILATSPRLFKVAGKPAGFVGLEGIYDLPTLAARWPTYPQWFLNAAFGADRRGWESASPTHRPVVARSPWLIVHQRGDELVDVAQSDLFSRHLREAGVRITDLRPEGGSHEGAVESLAQPDNGVARLILRLIQDERK